MGGTGYYLRDIGGGIKKYAVKKVGATTYYVDGNNGNDNNDGLSWKTAKKTIQSAITATEHWGTIYIKSGTYNENITISNKKISIIGQHSANTSVKADSGSVITIGLSAGVYIEGLEIECNSTDANDAAITTNVSIGLYDYIETYRCIIDGTNCYAVNLPGFFLADECIFKSGAVAINITDNIQYNSYRYSGVRIKDSYFTRLGDLSNQKCFTLGTSSRRVCLYRNNFIDFNTVLDVDGANHSIVQNNFINNVTNIIDVSTDSNYRENYFSDHTNIDNGYGICTQPYLFTTGADFFPVPIEDGWKLSFSQRSVLRKNTYGYETAGSVTFDGTTYVDLKSATVTADTQLTGVKMTTTGTFAGTPKYRILRDGVKVFPYNDENDIESGVLREFDFPINIPINSTYKVQIRSTDAGDTTQTVVLDELDKIEVI